MILCNGVGTTHRSFLAANIIAAVISFGTIANAANLYVDYFYTSTVNVFDPSGTDLGTFGNTGGQYPEGLAFDSHGNLYVANSGTDIGTYSIHKFGPTGTDLGKFASWQIGEPDGLAIDSRDNVYVAFNNNGTIHEYGPTGADLGTFATGPGDAHGLAFDGSGNLYLAVGGGFTNKIRKYSPTGALIGIFGLLSDANGLAFDSRGNLYVSDYSNNTIYKFDPTGVDLGVYASAGLNGPVGLAFDNSGNLYVANSAHDPSQSGSIHEFSATGDDLGTFATTGVGTGPEYLAFRPAPFWTGTSSANWADGGNWSDAVPGATAGTSNTDTAVFNQNAPHSPLTIDAARNVQNLTFDTASVNALTIGTVGGQALLLSAGGTIQTTSTVVNPQTVNAPLVLEGDYTFTSDASSSSATLSVGGRITPATTSGVTTLTLNGSNSGANTISGVLADSGSGVLAVTMNGPGTWTLSGANTYSGGTTVSGGTLTTTATGSIGSGPLVVSAADTITSTLNLGASQTVSSLSGTLAGSGSASVNIAGGTTLTVSQSSYTIFAGTLANSGTVAKTDIGTLELDGAPTLNNNSSLQANGGTLRFNVNSGAAMIGTGVTATVASGATLELAGSVSALSSGANRVKIINNSQQASGGMLLVSGTHQQVGAIDGTGDTVINDGSDLTANHIIQNALVIGVTGSSPAVATIAASDANGNPLAGGASLSSSLASNAPFAAGIGSTNLIDGAASNVASSADSDFTTGNSSAGPAAVPEPSTLALAGCGLAIAAVIRFRRRQRRLKTKHLSLTTVN